MAPVGHTDLDIKEIIASYLLNICTVEDIDQRCAHWLLFRQFKITGTFTGKTFLGSYSFR